MNDLTKSLNLNETDVINSTSRKLKKIITYKLTVSIILMLASLPILSHFYWLFETSYFSGLGIDPEIFNRPVFSSSTLNTTLFLISLLPVIKIIVWLIVIIIGLIGVIVIFNIFFKDFIRSRSGGISNVNRYLIRSGFNNTETYSLISLMLGFGVLLFLIAMYAGFAKFIQEEGYELAERRMNSFLKEDVECVNSWYSNVIGCYMIDGVEGKDHLVVLNSDTHIIYFSRESSANKYGVLTVVPRLFIKEKSSDKRYEVSRKYKVYKPAIKSE